MINFRDMLKRYITTVDEPNTIVETDWSEREYEIMRELEEEGLEDIK